MRVPHRIYPLVVLVLAAACGQGGPGSARINTMPDPATHDAFFPIAAGTKHALGSDTPPITCNSCHGGFSTFKQFDCLSCHQHSDQAALTAGHNGVAGFAYDSNSCYSCHSRGTAGTVPPGATSDPAESVLLTAEIPSYVETSISSFTPRNETLPMPMLHTSANVSATALASCGNCHANAGMGSYYPGDLHMSLVTLNLPQPASCTDCHATSVPTGFVGPTASNPARNPPSSEMKHDAVLWSNGAPTATSAVPQDCAVCHSTPTMTMQTWATGKSGTTPALFHASLTAAGLPQPASCVDCHANTRPVSLLTSVNAALPANVQFDHSAAAAMGDCTSCHANGGTTQWTSWSGGQFHLAGSAAPSTCLPCHASERPTSTTAPLAWVNPSYANSPFDYGGNSSSTHGDGQDCVVCHANPGTGVWGGTPKQNWAGGSFNHTAPGSDAALTCSACHTSQRPDLVYGAAAANTALSFDHSINGTGDCVGCHQGTTSYVKYLGSPPPVAGSSDWKGGMTYPGSHLISAPTQFITLSETTLSPAPPSLVTSTTSISATLHNAMLHTSAAIPPQVSPGPGPDNTTCWHCHTSTGTTVTSFANGQFHSALNNYSATPGGTVTPLPQPTTRCLDCHAQMRPANIVEKANSDLQPMDHNAAFTATVTIGGVAVNSVSGIECAVCHKSPGVTWTDGAFHSNIGSATPADCTTCHYPLMADAPKSDLTSGVNYVMKHASNQLTFQNCKSCHGSALSNATSTPASTLWQPGAFHASLTVQPTACLACHAVSEPAANHSTQSSVSYTFAMGGTSTNAAQWMNHGSGSVAGKDCVACHATDAKASGSAWSKSDAFHAAVTSPASCKECHGLTNGGGSTAGTNNNLPAGLTNSTMVTSAASDPSTGVATGTLDQINHADVNVSGHDCSFCHTQKGVSTVSGVQGKEWAQASFHKNFTAANPLVMDGTSGRCSDCHLNVKPTAAFTAFDHSALTDTPGSQDCSGCHTWPGTGTQSAPNWLGASGAAPALVTLTNWGYGSPTTNTVTFAHPAATTYTSCAQCHAGSNYTTIIDYNHDGLTRNVTINGVAATPNMGTSQYNLSSNPTFCVACHNSGSPWVSRGVSSTITANTAAGSTTVTTPSTSALTLGMTISGTGIPSTTTTTTQITGATVTAGSTTVTTATPVSLRAGTVISGTGIPANDTVATSVSNATSFTLTAAATSSATNVTLTATQTNPLTVTITAIPSATSITISSAANATTSGTTLTVTHKNATQVTIGSHGGSTNGEDCTSCHYVGGNQRLTPPTAGVFGTGSISGG